MEFKIIEAEPKHIEKVGELFDLYRQFYKYESNLIESTNYIKDRITNNESIIFIAINDANEAIGFVQLYETFGSLDLGKIIILYDLYVKKNHRKNNLKVAQNLYKKILKTNPNYAGVHYNLGITYKELGEYQKAISSYEKAIQIEPNYAHST